MEAMACGTPVIAYPSGALKAIVEQMQVWTELCLSKLSCRIAVLSDNHRNLQSAGYEQRLVAELLRQSRRIHQQYASASSAISAGEHIEFHSARFQQLSEQHDKWRFSRAPGRYVAHTDDRADQLSHWQQPAIVKGIPRCNDCAVDSREGIQFLFAA